MELRYAVYYGTITLDNGVPTTYTAHQIATLYGVQDEDYLAVPLVGPSPFSGGLDEVSYVHLKPLRDGRYYDAKERYNADDEIQWQEDFDARKNGKWADRPDYESNEEIA